MSDSGVRIKKVREKSLLRGDFSLNHILFDEKNRVCGVLDFGEMVLNKYESYMPRI